MILVLLLVVPDDAARSTKTADPSEKALTTEPLTDPRAMPVVGQVDREQIIVFSLLRTRPEGLPPAVRAALGAPIFGMNWTLAQRIPEAVLGTFWAVPANGYLCTVWQLDTKDAPGTVCAPTAQVRTTGLAAVSVTDPSASSDRRIIVGIAPDGTDRVRITTRASTRTLQIDRRGVFQLRDTVLSPPDRITPL